MVLTRLTKSSWLRSIITPPLWEDQCCVGAEILPVVINFVFLSNLLLNLEKNNVFFYIISTLPHYQESNLCVIFCNSSGRYTITGLVSNSRVSKLDLPNSKFL